MSTILKILGGLVVLGILLGACGVATGAAIWFWPRPEAVVANQLEQPGVNQSELGDPVEGVVSQSGGQQAFTRGQVDAVLGVGNWSCFDDRLDGVAVHNLPLNLVVAWPLSNVDKGPKYTVGQMVPGTGGATAWLQGTLASRAECSMPEQAVIPQQPTTGTTIDCQITKYGQITYWPPTGDQNEGRMVKILAPNAFVAPAGWWFNNERQTGVIEPGQLVTAGESSAWPDQVCYWNIK